MIRAVRNEIGDLLALLRTLAVLVIVGALYKELRTPPAQRTWHGRLFGKVPYDFRPPSIDRLRDAYWNVESDTVFTDRPVGVGWAVNIPPLLRRVGVMSERRPAARATVGADTATG